MQETNFMDSYCPNDVGCQEAAELIAFMGNTVVKMVQCTLECHQDLWEGKLHPM